MTKHGLNQFRAKAVITEHDEGRCARAGRRRSELVTDATPVVPASSEIELLCWLTTSGATLPYENTAMRCSYHICFSIRSMLSSKCNAFANTLVSPLAGNLADFLCGCTYCSRHRPQRKHTQPPSHCSESSGIAHNVRRTPINLASSRQRAVQVFKPWAVLSVFETHHLPNPPYTDSRFK